MIQPRPQWLVNLLNIELYRATCALVTSDDENNIHAWMGTTKLRFRREINAEWGVDLIVTAENGNVTSRLLSEQFDAELRHFWLALKSLAFVQQLSRREEQLHDTLEMIASFQLDATSSAATPHRPENRSELLP
jgi:hypothetical protein